ncbi:S-adenosyl-L-methionine-dependent methyltransferase [Nemania sp. FL0031]|nr:S-adenosyl-L-methionine-dependent methyltransferase [Nemania sp. FL0031]
MNVKVYDEGEKGKKKKRPLRQKRNPIEAAISTWFEKHAAQLKNQYDVSDLIAQAPKRWTAYGPLVLLPSGSFTSLAWSEALDLTSTVAQSARSADHNEGTTDSSGPALLWKTILTEISESPKTKLTHLAINEGIPLHSKERSDVETKFGVRTSESENILRSPSGLRMLYGDFGPSTTSTSIPTEADFARAFWVSTKQNGITQTWAPRWTMFSRGNIKEKARLLAFHDKTDAKGQSDPRDHNSLSHRYIPAAHRAGAVAVDLYAGIGYFAFCYAALGFRVLCWELNPWSVEGLRRGAVANGWGVRVAIPLGSEYKDKEEEMLRDVLAGDETIIVFLEDNTRAASRIRKLDELTRGYEQETREGKDQDREPERGIRMRNIMHVNLGLLPSSQGSWGTAWDVASQAPQAWFHVHENVGVADIKVKKEEIREWFAEQRAKDGTQTDLSVEHVELVKTFAPGVWHCVFDLYVRRDIDTADNIT